VSKAVEAGREHDGRPDAGEAPLAARLGRENGYEPVAARREARLRLDISAKELAVSITIKLVSIPVDDQAKALEFYTEKFGFEKRADVSQGDYRWLTVTAPEGSPDVELVLEPNVNPASKDYQASLREQGIPIRRSSRTTSRRITRVWSVSE